MRILPESRQTRAQKPWSDPAPDPTRPPVPPEDFASVEITYLYATSAAHRNRACCGGILFGSPPNIELSTGGGLCLLSSLGARTVSASRHGASTTNRVRVMTATRVSLSMCGTASRGCPVMRRVRCRERCGIVCHDGEAWARTRRSRCVASPTSPIGSSTTGRGRAGFIRRSRLKVPALVAAGRTATSFGCVSSQWRR